MKKIILPAILLLFASLPGCKPVAEPLRIVSSPWPGYEPIYLARDLGYLDEKQAILNELPSSNITLESFSNGSADIATITLDETLTLLAQGKQVRILAVLDVSHGADAVMAKPHVRTLAELKGKRIAVVNIPLGVYMLSRTLDAAGLAARDVSVVLMPEDKHEKAYLQNRIDAAVTFEPYKTRLAQAGAHKLFDSSRIPNEIFDLLVVSEEAYQTRRQELCHIAQQWFRTLDYVQANAQEAGQRMSKRMGMDAGLYQGMMRGLQVPAREENLRLLTGQTPAILQPAQNLARAMFDARLLPAAVDAAAALAPDFLPACFATQNKPAS
jgi:NitT/TauT family transport system substrate-binding protein